MPLSHSAGTANSSTDPEMENKVKKASEKISENLHIFANEPSLACYRLQEHIHKSLPQLVLKRIEVNQMHRELQGKCYDLEYAINAIKSMQKSHDHFRNIHQLILQAITVKQRLNNEESKKSDKKKTTPAASPSTSNPLLQKLQEYP
ncbi:BLOC-1-related complex subunit 8 homolog isoform X2 [Stegodyphus dumicola]|nr:BLOC-1-related complex subunit 8 homolog isoform X2 [Stegodyphus dumicola]XP_035216300.1 BLOC-1-related complex subunit 8 homolog isoform X2 [Stegodyphus dumicola]